MERQDKPAVARLAQVSAKIDEAKAASDAIRAEIAVLNGTLDKIKAEREAANAKLDAMRAEQQEARSDIPGLMVEKKELWEVIQTLRDKQREIRDSFNKKWEEFKKQDKAWKGWFAQERKRRCAAWACLGGGGCPAPGVCCPACLAACQLAQCQFISTLSAGNSRSILACRNMWVCEYACMTVAAVKSLVNHLLFGLLFRCSVCCRQEQRKVEYEERQAARKARDGESAKPAKFEMEVSSSYDGW
jgi:small-conductance mechanosensitive channel